MSPSLRLSVVRSLPAVAAALALALALVVGLAAPAPAAAAVPPPCWEICNPPGSSPLSTVCVCGAWKVTNCGTYLLRGCLYRSGEVAPAADEAAFLAQLSASDAEVPSCDEPRSETAASADGEALAVAPRRLPAQPAS